MRLLLTFAFLLTGTVAPAAPVKVIFDTDMDSDCDDVGALAVLHALADLGEAEILATVTSSKNEWSAACVDAINTYYGRPGLPVGCPKGAGASKPSKYAKPIADRFPHAVGTGDAVADATAVYRKVLAAQPDGSVAVVTVGYLTNLADLIKQPGGAELVKAKVKTWVCMGGNFVGSPAVDDLKLGNNNFTFDKAAALHAVAHWPTPVVFVGREIGSVPSGLKVGAKLATLPKDNPIRLGYECYFGGPAKDRHVADQTTVLYAVRGLGAFWTAGPSGAMDLRPDMTFRWRADAAGKQSYVLKRTADGKPTDRAVERAIEELMLRPPASARPR